MKRNMGLLFIDDDADDRVFFTEAVKEYNADIRCVTANSGLLALQLLKNPEEPLPDFIFLDIRMPVINGKKCLLEIKNDQRLSHIPVIIFTTSKDVEESRELLNMGAFHFISKPNHPEEIYYLVSFVLEEQINSLRRKNER